MIEIKVSLEGIKGNRDFIDWAARLTINQRGLDQFEKAMGARFLEIIKKVETADGALDMAAEDVVDELYEYFKDFNYNVSKDQCLKILYYHKTHHFNNLWDGLASY